MLTISHSPTSLLGRLVTLKTSQELRMLNGLKSQRWQQIGSFQPVGRQNFANALGYNLGYNCIHDLRRCPTQKCPIQSN